MRWRRRSGQVRADITAITGGNPLLLADSRHVFNARVNIRPFTETNLNINASYSSMRFRNPTESFPGATAEIEAAFPDRFVRGPDGRLLSIDYRPVNFEQRDRSLLRWGIDFSIPISSPQAKRMQERRTAFQSAMAESRRTGQPLPPEMTAQLDQFRRLGQQQSLFGGNQRAAYLKQTPAGLLSAAHRQARNAAEAPWMSARREVRTSGTMKMPFSFRIESAATAMIVP